MFCKELYGMHGPVKGPGLIAKIVMHRCGGTVKAQRDHLNICLLDCPAGRRGDQGAVGGQAHAQAKGGAVGSQIKDVLPQQGLAPREYHHGIGRCPDVVEEPFSLISGEVRVPCHLGLGRGTAMHAAQIAAPGGLPGNPFGYEIHLFVFL